MYDDPINMVVYVRVEFEKRYGGSYITVIFTYGHSQFRHRDYFCSLSLGVYTIVLFKVY